MLRRLRSSRHLDGLLHAVSLGRVYLLARLCDLSEDGLVRQRGDDFGGLVLEGDFVAFDTCTDAALVSKPVESAAWGSERVCWLQQRDGRCHVGAGEREMDVDGFVDVPSSFLRTLSMAPEQPPQDMVTSNS